MANAGMTQKETDEKNRDRCRYIADEIEAYASGMVYRDESGNVHDLKDGETAPDDWEQLGLLDYLEDVLDVRYTVDREFDYRSCALLVTFGGPNVWVDTARKSVDLYWRGDEASYPLSTYACDALDDCMRERYECMR